MQTLLEKLVEVYGEDMVADFQDFCGLNEKLELLLQGKVYDSLEEVGEECEAEL